MVASDYDPLSQSAMAPAREAFPNLLNGFRILHGAAFDGDALDLRRKRIIALRIATAVRCERCIDAHVHASFKAGVTTAQIHEAAAVAVLMGGGPAKT
ncbi:hypothetical protein LzC2_19840 [Planctomycetes bacterium LzC2]|uniref:Carboxymuconolactone decarboxylase-like domain-containing protein n=2 Tax=Alienimonas chondri TaxID=2681879 RepID=A0ABX1VF46_9PLAN|nr:hypothetical protein [Alienimonas chondri]